MNHTYALTTLGCKVNQYETQQLRELIESYGLHRAPDGQAADLAVVNTCAVTCSAGAKSRQAIRQAARRGRSTVVVVGCHATADPAGVAAIPGVAAVIGHDDTLQRLRTLIEERFGSATEDHRADSPHKASERDTCLRADGNEESIIPVSPPDGLGPISASHPTTHSIPGPALNVNIAASPRRLDPTSSRPMATGAHGPASGCVEAVADPDPQWPGIHAFADRQRAFLKIQDGCDAHCTYCIIPRLRSHLRSTSIDQAVEEARDLVAAGHREIVLTGIFLGAYGRQTALRRRQHSVGSPLADLIDAVARVDGLERLRLSSLEPGDVDHALLAVMARHDCCVPHLHLPLQSGSDAILRKMNRQYDVAAFQDMIEQVNGVFDRPAITTDIIVGFPGETDDDFADTCRVARQSRFAKIHAFPFSPRPQTAAARWTKEFVPSTITKARMAHLRDLEQSLTHSYREKMIGTVERIIVERVDPSTGLARGRCDRYVEVWFDAPDCHPGDVVLIQIDRIAANRTHGTLVA
ncbi:MAG: tRNA (N(6)-L-threonylcarbamoyladenosine(37)-C(2))-methylthiotransferase MtaB [Planctomycetes bacterium]|nr:tRNA (N(6)-L-threonylcarbamoyladenosine(37)-C(2))-methylthiotransferase MtaB [Planctomycetota bacterium]